MDSVPTGPLKADIARRESFGSQNSQTAKEYVLRTMYSLEVM
jgi:hypothetical protein